MNAQIHFANTSAVALRKEIRNRNYCYYFDISLQVHLVNIHYVKSRIALLKNMGEDIREFRTYLSDLLLQQLQNLARVAKSPHLKINHNRLREVDTATRKILWPTE